MNEPPVIEQTKARRKRLAVWGVVAGLGSLALGGWFLVWLFLVHPRTPSRSTPAASAPLPSPSAQSSSPFATVQESAIPGRYKWTEGEAESFMVLYDDHTFMNRDGTIFSMYQWQLTPDALVVTWSGGTLRLTEIEAPGIYTTTKRKGVRVRMEKLPPYTPAQLEPPTPIASIQFGAQCTTNGLTPVNTGDGDGEIFPGTVRDVNCYQMRRKENRPAAYLYLQIAQALKETPFTNALVMVEYFDPPPIGPKARLWIQHDAQGAVYANTQALPLAGSETWQHATFYLARARFESRQNSGGDFRLCTDQPELFVRSIKLVKNTILPETKLPTSSPR